MHSVLCFVVFYCKIKKITFSFTPTRLRCAGEECVRRQNEGVSMPQNSETGRQGRENGYNNADEIGALLGATRISNNSNEFRWDDEIIVIKTGSSAVVTRAMLTRVTAIVYGERKNTEWRLYKINPKVFEKLSVQSRSRNHNENYRLVRHT